jgi:hypothetical protein
MSCLQVILAIIFPLAGTNTYMNVTKSKIAQPVILLLTWKVK